MSPRAFRVLTHGRPSEVAEGLERLGRAAGELDIELRFDHEETRKHGLTARPGVAVDADGDDGVELAFVLGGDGTILRALRRFSGTEVAVLAVLQLLPDLVLGWTAYAPALGQVVSPDWTAAPNSRALSLDAHAADSSVHDIGRRSIHGRSRHAV